MPGAAENQQRTREMQYHTQTPEGARDYVFKTQQNNHPENLHLLPKISEAQESLDGLISEDLSLFEASP